MPDGKSKHPGLVKAAIKDVADLKANVGKAGPALKALASAATSLKSAADTAEKAYKDQLKYCEKLIDSYAEKGNELADLEQQLKEAKGDRKKEAEVLKKHKKADGEADGLRKDYNTAVLVFEAITDALRDSAAQIAELEDKVQGFSADTARRALG